MQYYHQVYYYSVNTYRMIAMRTGSGSSSAPHPCSNHCQYTDVSDIPQRTSIWCRVCLGGAHKNIHRLFSAQIHLSFPKNQSRTRNEVLSLRMLRRQYGGRKTEVFALCQLWGTQPRAKGSTHTPSPEVYIQVLLPRYILLLQDYWGTEHTADPPRPRVSRI